MKKFLLVSVITLFAYISLHAQADVSFGLRVSPTSDWSFVSDTGSDYSYVKTGMNLGIGFGPSLRYGLSDNFNVDISGIFTWQKFEINQINDVTKPIVINRTEDFKIQYLKIPVNFNGLFDLFGDFQALINFGAAAGIRLKSERLITDNHNENQLSSDYDRVSVINFVDLYLAAGAGLVYNIEDNLHLSVTFQYNNGILDAWLNNKNELPSTIQELTLKHRNVAFNLGLYIDI